MPVDNPFLAEAADRYHHGRPYHHEATLSRLLAEVPVARGRAVDVACGTGLSTRALRSLGFTTVGVDVSRPMLAVAALDPDATLVVGSAEALPIATGSIDLVTVSSGVHWFDQEPFYAEVRRVLGPDGALVMYEHGFLAHSPVAEGIADWMEHEYLVRFPMPPRSAQVGQLDEPPGFLRVHVDERTDGIDLDQRGIVDYLLTQSNTVAPIDRGEATVEEVRAWLLAGTAPLLDDPAAPVPYTFWGRAEVLRARA